MSCRFPARLVSSITPTTTPAFRASASERLDWFGWDPSVLLTFVYSLDKKSYPYWGDPHTNPQLSDR